MPGSSFVNNDFPVRRLEDTFSDIKTADVVWKVSNARGNVAETDAAESNVTEQFNPRNHESAMDTDIAMVDYPSPSDPSSITYIEDIQRPFVTREQEVAWALRLRRVESFCIANRRHVCRLQAMLT